jgi:hypothetical protein
LALLVAIGLCVALTGCSQKPPSVGGSSSSKAENARKDAEMLALNGVRGGADAQAKAVPEARRSISINAVILPDPPKPPQPPAFVPAPRAPKAPEVVKGAPTPRTPPRPGPPAIIRERIVSSMPYPTEAEAEDDALAQARDLVEQKLAALDPPVRYKPSLAEVKAEFLRPDSRTVRPPDAEEKETFARYGVTGNLVYVAYDVEVTADQIRELRAQERVSAGMRLLGVLVAVALAGFCFLRADEWTKGYLTRWLAIAAVVLAGGAAAVLMFV